ncbi:hypothetical protein QBG57_001566 [Shigella sonnei]|nr:hypothetical protein [Shigella sonnei]EJO8896918.1 hypothetical protein [Shigella sonnei]EKS2277878.1 hypothetical protein [Shigella sonnei]HCR7546744.1 hypothetical protein [Shigella sonnei]
MNVQAIFILMVVQLFGKEIAVTIEELQAVLVSHRLLSQLVKFRSA